MSTGPLDNRKEDIYQSGYQAAKLDSVISGIDKLHSKLDAMASQHNLLSQAVSNMSTTVGELEQHSKDHENRMRDLEKSDKKWAILVTAITGVFSLLLKFVIP